MRRALPSILAAFAMAGASRGALASPDSCAPVKPAFSMSFSPTGLDQSMTLDALAALARSAGLAPSGKGRVTGVYIPQVRTNIHYGLTVQLDPSTRQATACFTNVEVALETRSTIHLAAELPRGGCAESAVYAHERHHHEIQVEQTRAAADSFLAINPPPSVPFRGADQRAAAAGAEAYAKIYASQLTQSVVNFVQPKQLEFDSPEEYSRVSQLCASETGRIFAGRPAR